MQRDQARDYLLERGGHGRALSIKRLFFDFLWVTDFLTCVAAAFLSAMTIRGIYQSPLAYTFDNALLVGGIFGVGVVAYSIRIGRYDRSRVLTAGSGAGLNTGVEAVLRAWLVGAFLVLLAGFVFKNTAHYSRVGLALSGLYIFIALVAARIVATRAAIAMSGRGGVLNIRTALVGEGNDLGDTARMVESTHAGFSVIRTLPINLTPDESFDLETDGREDSLAAAFRDLSEMVREGAIDQIFVPLDADKVEQTVALVDRLRVLTVPVNVVVDPRFHDLLHHPVHEAADQTVIEIRPHRLDGFHGILKVLFDYGFSALALLLISPFMVLIALAIKLDSPGPVFFRQQRHGLAHSVFRIYKFRTMRVMEDGATIPQARKGDERITRVGAFLRKTSLDELPQFINVLRGEMSVVGPRPHAIAHNREHMALVRDYALRHNVKPGITGWAQVNGFRGETDTLEKMAHRVALDTHYIRNWSLWFDVKIVLMTIWALIRPKNAY